MVSPVPTVTEAMIAPGPKTRRSLVQLPDRSGLTGGYSMVSGCNVVFGLQEPKHHLDELILIPRLFC